MDLKFTNCITSLHLKIATILASKYLDGAELPELGIYNCHLYVPYMDEKWAVYRTKTLLVIRRLEDVHDCKN